MDDTAEVIEARVVEYNTKTLAVAELYKAQGKLHVVDGMGELDEVFGRLTAIIDNALATA